MTPERGGDRLDGDRFDDHDIPTVTYRHDDDSVVVSVGSGAGGATIADELSGNGIDTIVLLQVDGSSRCATSVNEALVLKSRS